MIINEVVLMELNQQRRAQVADTIAALRVNKGHRRAGTLLRRNHGATAGHPAANPVPVPAGSATA